MSDYLRYAFETLTEPPQLDRRDFLKQFGAGIVILISLGDLLRGQDPGRRRGTPQDFNAFLRIAEDGSVTGFTGKAELGQGVTTAMAQLLAEELDAPVASITMVMGDTDLCPWDMGTFGSMSVRFLGPVFRQAAAEARAVLVALAVEALGADAAELVTRDGAVMVAGDESRRIGYGELARGQAIHRVIEGEAAIQDAREYTVVGRDHLALESRAKVTGAAVYSGDVRRPGMLYARIVRPPAHDSTLESVDTAAAEARPGVRVVRDGDLIAVLHATPDGAAEALAAVRARWTPTRMSMDTETIFDHLMERAPAAQAQDEAGDPAAAEARAAHVEAVEYRQGYVAHAPMETHTAVAEIADGKVTVWASTQTPFSARDEVARALGRAPEEVRVIPPFVGGGFGGKGQNPQVVEAARLAELAGAPVHLEWTRAEEFFHDTFQPAAVVRVRSGVSAEGDLVSWDYAVAYAGTRGAEVLYRVPDRRVAAHGRGWRAAPGTHPFGTGAWRAPGANTNAFARESQIDRMAAAVGMDPLEFRRRNLEDARMRAVLDAAAERYGWKPPAEDGVGHGIACTTDAGTWNATMAQVRVDRETGRVRVERVVCAQDMGLVVNPHGATIQAEGCITMGLGYALSEELRFRGGEVLDDNFHTYRIPRFSWVPEIEVVFVDTGIAAPHGGGEPAIVGMGAVIANAIADATGARLTRMPMTPERVLEALAAQS
jgi:nicotinate dehydrogenase subunit B